MLTVANVARASEDWRWIADSSNSVEYNWHFESTLPRNYIEKRFKLFNLGRLRAGFAVRRLCPDIVFSHGPWETLYTAFMLAGNKEKVRHVAMSFNFTDLPTGMLLGAMRQFFPSIERFVVFSKIERDLYSQLFDIPVDRFEFIHWGVNPPIESPSPVIYDQPYFVALGGEARDYNTVIAAAKSRPKERFVIIARPDSVREVDIPSNVTLRINVPFQDAWSTVWHAAASLIILRNANTPNGHVTLVGSMLLGKAVVVTDSSGVRDYVSQDETALLVAAGSPEALADAVDRLIDDPKLGLRLGQNARSFAETHCTERSIANYVQKLLVETAR